MVTYPDNTGIFVVNYWYPEMQTNITVVQDVSIRNQYDMYGNCTTFLNCYNTKAYPYTKKMLLDLKKLNIHVGLVTNKPKQETIWTLNHTGLNDIFEIIICPEDVKNCKPNPEGILLAINHFNVNLEDTLYVGDGERDYLSSRNANIDFAFVKWSPRKISNQQYIKYHISSYKNFIKEIGIEND